MDFTELRHLAEQIETECGKAIIGKNCVVGNSVEVKKSFSAME